MLFPSIIFASGVLVAFVSMVTFFLSRPEQYMHELNWDHLILGRFCRYFFNGAMYLGIPACWVFALIFLC